jgi:hypothetical protein
MKILLASILLLSSVCAFANSKPCLTQARKAVYANLGDIEEDADCDVKLSKVSQSEDVVSYSADISCVNDGGFFDMTDFIIMKYKKLANGSYSCLLQ